MQKRLYAVMDIPNQEGFKFIGVDEDRDEFPCTVKKDSIGCHSVYRDLDGEPCFNRLIGWKEIV